MPQDRPDRVAVIFDIDELAGEGFALAVGSPGPTENVQLALDRLHRRSLFSAHVSGSDVEYGKPDPSVFQVASQRLGVLPDYSQSV